jgi:hypothetical protein
MNADLGLSQATYGLSSATFYVGYCLFEVPGRVILEKVGALDQGRDRQLLRRAVRPGCLHAIQCSDRGRGAEYSS